MNIEAPSIIREIEREAESQAEAIIRSAGRVAERETASARKKAETWQQDVTARLRSDTDRRMASARAEARGEANSMLLEKRTDLLDRAIKMALKTLAEMPRDENYLTLLQQYAYEGVKALDIERGLIRCSHRDKEFLLEENRFDRLVSALRERSRTHVQLQLAPETVPVAGGLIVESPDGSVSYHNTFDEIALRRRDFLLVTAAERIFKRESSDE